MTLWLLAYLAGLITIATPCILPVLPFVLAQSGKPFLRHGLPMLLGLASAFTVVASLASVAGGWAVKADYYGRLVALGFMIVFGVTMLSPTLAARVMYPLASLGEWVAGWAGHRDAGSGMGTSVLLGVATGLAWAPCAGPVLGLILTSAALRGPSVQTSALLLVYGLGAASALAAVQLFGRTLLDMVRGTQWIEWARRAVGVAAVAGSAFVALGLDGVLLSRFSLAYAGTVEQNLVTSLGKNQAAEVRARAKEAARPLSGPLRTLLDQPKWLNTAPLGPEDLRGKVVVVNFWTYSCINCLRTLPYVRAWADKYKDQGVVVIGVHAPEFAFERNEANVRQALGNLGVRYPVIADNDFRIWQAFDNQAWPALYFIDANGRIRHRALGEGDYAQSERVLQQLVFETKGTPPAKELVADPGRGAQASPDLANLESGETYVGYDKATGFASPSGFAEDVSRMYQAPLVLSLNHWALEGSWTVRGEFAELSSARGGIRHRFHARDLHLVMGPAQAGNPVRFRVLIDGHPPGADHGADVDAEGWGSAADVRLYQLVRQSGAVANRTAEVEFFDGGIRAYSFTFG